MLDPKRHQELQALVASDPVVLFMKGTPTFPRCGFSNQVVQILRAHGAPFKAVDILEDESLRQDLKTYSRWPTFPQVYLGGNLIGGSDIIREMWEKGELVDALRTALPDMPIQTVAAPARVRVIEPAEARTLIQSGIRYRLLDVRTVIEHQSGTLDQAELFDEACFHQLMDQEDKATRLIFFCATGGRSHQAAEYFCQQGFKFCYNVVGGLVDWDRKGIPRTFDRR
jgi:monothiol glutaredoxin